MSLLSWRRQGGHAPIGWLCPNDIFDMEKTYAQTHRSRMSRYEEEDPLSFYQSNMRLKLQKSSQNYNFAARLARNYFLNYVKDCLIGRCHPQLLFQYLFSTAMGLAASSLPSIRLPHRLPFSQILC